MDNTNNKSINAALGLRLEGMYHSAAVIYGLARQLVADAAVDDVIPLAIKEIAKGQARELELMAEHFQGTKIGYYAERFANNDAAVILAAGPQGSSA